MWRSKLLSIQNWRKTTTTPLSWNFNDWVTSDQFLSSSPRANSIDRSDLKGIQLDWILNDDGKLFVDFIGRYENLQQDFGKVCDNIGLPRQVLLHTNKTRHRPYWDCYDENTKNIVATKYKKDIEYFGYEFGK